MKKSKPMSKAFFASPYAPEYSWIREGVATACRSEGVVLVVADEVIGAAEKISSNMEELMQNCNFCIAVVSGCNPNVMYEQGYIRALGKPVLVLYDQATTLPFDIAEEMAIKYHSPQASIPTKVIKDLLQEKVRNALRNIKQLVRQGKRVNGLVISSKKAAKRLVFGYFFYRIEGFERILIRKVESNKWDFPLRGEVEGSLSPRLAIDRLIKGFVNENQQRKNWFYNSQFESPEVFEIYPYKKCPITRNSTGAFPFSFPPLFFKVQLSNTEVKTPEPHGVYCWASKSLLFRKMLLKEVDQMGEPRSCRPLDPLLLLWARSDKILLECGLKILDCVDVITYREFDHGERLILFHRSDDPDPHGDSHWEYPKGGLEYHETPHEGAIRELLEETGIGSIGMFRYGGTLAQSTTDVSGRNKEYDTLRVRALTYKFIGDANSIRFSPEHDKYEWTDIRKAIDKTWMEYGKEFLKLWESHENEINVTAAPPVSLAFQVTEKCTHTCMYCHRRIAKEKHIDEGKIRDLIDILAQRRILRLTFTGGEPLFLGKDFLFKIIEYSHNKGIHTCLSTTGVAGHEKNDSMNENDLKRLDSCLDHLLLSLNCIDEKTAQKTYKSLDDWRELFDKVVFLLQRTNDYRFHVEVCTAVTRKNINSVQSIGEMIFSLNAKAYWRIDEYYPNGSNEKVGNGRYSSQRKKFELKSGVFDELVDNIKRRFPGQTEAGRVRFNTKKARENAPDIMLTPQANLVTSSKSIYQSAGIMEDLRSLPFANRRPFAEYRAYCRNWPWDTQSDWEGYSGEDDFINWIETKR